MPEHPKHRRHVHARGACDPSPLASHPFQFCFPHFNCQGTSFAGGSSRPLPVPSKRAAAGSPLSSLSSFDCCSIAQIGSVVKRVDQAIFDASQGSLWPPVQAVARSCHHAVSGPRVHGSIAHRCHKARGELCPRHRIIWRKVFPLRGLLYRSPTGSRLCLSPRVTGAPTVSVGGCRCVFVTACVLCHACCSLSSTEPEVLLHCQAKLLA